MSLALAIRKDRLLVVRDAAATLKFYDGVATPDTPELPALDQHLATITLNSGAIGDAAGVASLTFTVPLIGSAMGTGVIGWVRFADVNGDGILDCLVAAVGGTAPVIVSDRQVYVGGEIQLLSCVMYE